MLSARVNQFIDRSRRLHGDPHYVAMGVAIGVFVAVTPTIPFHTVLVISLTCLFRASLPAAYLGAWLSNPFTVIFLYLACYKVGLCFYGGSAGGSEPVAALITALGGDAGFAEKWRVFTGFVRSEVNVFWIMNLGGLVLGIPSGIVSYFITRYLLKKNRISA